MATATRRRRTFGPLLYVTLALAVASTVVVGIWSGVLRNGVNHAAYEIPPDDSAAGLIAGLAGGNAEVRAGAAEGLGAVLHRSVSGDDTSGRRGEAMAALRKALKDEDASVRIAAAQAMGGLWRPSRPTIDALTAALDDGDQTVQLTAARSLLHAGEEMGPALRTLERLVRDRALVPRQSTPVEVLVTAGAPGEAAALRAIGAMLADPDEDVRLDAVDLLPSLGPASGRVAPMLEPLWGSPDPRVRFTAALASLQLIEPGPQPDPRLAPVLEAAALDPSRSFDLRHRALAGLFDLAPAALRRCGIGLAHQLELDDADARLNAATLLHAIDPETLAGKRGPTAGR